MAGTLKDVMGFFGLTPKEFTPEWRKMTDKDKEEFKSGVGAFYELPEAARDIVIDTPTLSPEHKDAGVLTY